jgi:hypothetical protein
MSITLQDQEIPIYKNRCYRLIINSPANLPPSQWIAEFHRETVKYIQNIPSDQYITPTIESTIESLSNKTFTREDGSILNVNQILNDIKIISDTLYLESI